MKRRDFVKLNANKFLGDIEREETRRTTHGGALVIAMSLVAISCFFLGAITAAIIFYTVQ